jgi:hypothetical protein
LESLKQPKENPVIAARIRNTLHLEELWLTEKALQSASGCEKTGEIQPLEFNEAGDLLPGR